MTLLPKRTQFAENIRLLGKGVNARDFYNTQPQRKGAPENRRALPEIFGKEEKQYRGACGLPFGKPLLCGCCFDECRGENAVPTNGRAAIAPQNHGIPQRLCARNA